MLKKVTEIFRWSLDVEDLLLEDLFIEKLTKYEAILDCYWSTKSNEMSEKSDIKSKRWNIFIFLGLMARKFEFNR